MQNNILPAILHLSKDLASAFILSLIKYSSKTGCLYCLLNLSFTITFFPKYTPL